MANWTDNIVIVGPTKLVKNTNNSVASGTIDLRTSYGAYVFCKIGYSSATAIGSAVDRTAGVSVSIRRVLNNNTYSAGGYNPTGIVDLTSDTAKFTASTTTSSISGKTIVVVSGTGFATGDYVSIVNNLTTPTEAEFLRVSFVSGTSITMDTTPQYAWGATGYILNKATVLSPIWVDGGSLIQVVFDYGQSTTNGEDSVVCAHAQKYIS